MCKKASVIEIFLHPVSFTGYIFLNVAMWNNWERKGKKNHTHNPVTELRKSLVQIWLCHWLRDTGQAAVLNSKDSRFLGPAKLNKYINE